MALAAPAYPLESVQALDREIGTGSESVQLEVQMLTGRIVVPCKSFLASAPLTSVKESVRAVIGIPVRHQRLIWQTTVLGDDLLLGDLSLPAEGAILQLVISLPQEDQVAPAREALRQASAALDVLSVASLSELKNMTNPPAGVGRVLEAVIQLRAGIDPAIALDSRGRVKDSSWKASKKIIQNPKRFIADLREFRMLAENGSIPAGNVDAACRIRDSMGDHFSYDAMRQTSAAAASLTLWVLNTIQYIQMCQVVRAKFEGFDIMSEIRDQLAM